MRQSGNSGLQRGFGPYTIEDEVRPSTGGYMPYQSRRARITRKRIVRTMLFCEFKVLLVVSEIAMSSSGCQY